MLSTDLVREVDAFMLKGWRRFADHVLPLSLREDDWVSKRGPVAVLKKYGQNLPYGRDQDQEEEARIFNDECLHEEVLCYSFSVATPLL
jgi:hypothetical protein